MFLFFSPGKKKNLDLSPSLRERKLKEPCKNSNESKLTDDLRQLVHDVVGRRAKEHVNKPKSANHKNKAEEPRCTYLWGRSSRRPSSAQPRLLGTGSRSLPAMTRSAPRAWRRSRQTPRHAARTAVCRSRLPLGGCRYVSHAAQQGRPQALRRARLGDRPSVCNVVRGQAQALGCDTARGLFVMIAPHLGTA